MPGASETLTFDQFERMAQATGRDLSSMSLEEPLRASRLLCIAATKENFAGSHGPDGQAWPPLRFERPQGGSIPLRNTGMLMGSATSPGQGHVDELSSTRMVVGTNYVSAPLHQYGGVQKPSKAKALPIPLTKEAARAGSPLVLAQQLGVKLGLVKRPGKPPLLVESRKGPKGVQAIFHYVLVSQVTIPARPFIGFGESLIAKLDRLWSDFFGRRIDRNGHA